MPTSLAVYGFDNLYLILAIYVVPAFLSNLYAGPTFGMTQSLAPLAMRASASTLAICSLVYILSFVHYYLASKHLKADLARSRGS